MPANPGATFTLSTGLSRQLSLRNPGCSPSWDALELAAWIWEGFADGPGSGSFACHVRPLLDWEKWEDLHIGFWHERGFEKPSVVMEVACGRFWFSAMCFIQRFAPPTPLKFESAASRSNIHCEGQRLNHNRKCLVCKFYSCLYEGVWNVSNEVHKTSFFKKKVYN